MAFLPHAIPVVGTASGNVPTVPIPLASMNQTDLAAYNAANPGPTGPTGAQGDAGSQGPSGATGTAGAKGDKGDTGSAGTNGTNGSAGATGSTGATGPSNMPTMTANTTSSIGFNSSGLNETVYNTSASLLATATITLPSASASGQIIRYTSNGAIGTLTVTGTVDVGSALTALAANTVVAWQATGTNGHWVRI